MTAKNQSSPRVFLIHYGELGLKGKNLGDFEKRLRNNITSSIKKINLDTDITLDIKHKYLELTIGSDLNSADRSDPAKQLIDILKTTFGISWFTLAQKLPRESSLEQISDAIVNLAQTKATSEQTFKVNCKRADKSFEQSSVELERELGGKIIQNTKFEKVNLSDPEHTFHIEINRESIYIFETRYKGLGGLPVGANGKVLVLLSGGIDSPVASYYIAKRGCNVDFLHFYVHPEQNDSKIAKLCKQIKKYTGEGRLLLAPYLPFNLEVMNIKTKYELVLFRRFTLKVAEKLANTHGYQAVVTGDNLGQVASQTLENLAAADDALEDLICFRPLIGFDKQEIIEKAQELETFELSNLPGKDCCSIIDRHAKTKVTLDKIREEEKKIENYEQLLKQTIHEMEEM